MQLKTGFYYISTLATSPWGERWVQRDSSEDKTLNPKAVNVQVDEPGAAEVTYSGSCQTAPTNTAHKTPLLTQPSLPQWYLEQIDDTQVFQLSASSINADPAVTINKDDKLFSDVTGGPAQNWTVTECGETCEEGVFM